MITLHGLLRLRYTDYEYATRTLKTTVHRLRIRKQTSVQLCYTDCTATLHTTVQLRYMDCTQTCNTVLVNYFISQWGE
jgi:hypothetical protein